MTVLTPPPAASYDVIIIGGAMVGSSIAFWTSQNPDFDGSILVVDRDLTYETASTSHTNSCIRQQFGTEINIRISQFGAEFIHNFQDIMQDDDAPKLTIQNFGYMYLADNEDFANILRDNQVIQSSLGAGTQILTPEEIAARYPFYNLEDVVAAAHNTLDEGYFDGGTIFDWFRRKARKNGVTYIQNEVVSIARDGARVNAIMLKSGETVQAGQIINASGPRASLTAKMVGLEIPVEPRRRFTYIFDAAEPLTGDLPLTIDPSGVHMRSDGRYYMAGCPPDDGDPAMDPTDFPMDHNIWENKVWPALANRVPAFERIKLINEWVGHYAFNTLDQNAIIGAHPEIDNFLFCNGFSGHGLQQSPAMGRAMSELIVHGRYQTLDLSPLGFERIVTQDPLVERAVI